MRRLQFRTIIIPLCIFSISVYVCIIHFGFKEAKLLPFNPVQTNENILDVWVKQQIFHEEINCDSIFNHSDTEIKKAKYFMKKNPLIQNDSLFFDFTQNCMEFREKRGYKNVYNNSDFAIAYIISFYKNLEQMEFLLQAIYSPYNYYCVHVDKSASQVFTFIF